MSSLGGTPVTCTGGYAIALTGQTARPSWMVQFSPKACKPDRGTTQMPLTFSSSGAAAVASTTESPGAASTEALGAAASTTTASAATSTPKKKLPLKIGSKAVSAPLFLHEFDFSAAVSANNNAASTTTSETTSSTSTTISTLGAPKQPGELGCPISWAQMTSIGGLKKRRAEASVDDEGESETVASDKPLAVKRRRLNSFASSSSKKGTDKKRETSTASAATTTTLDPPREKKSRKEASSSSSSSSFYLQKKNRTQKKEKKKETDRKNSNTEQAPGAVGVAGPLPIIRKKGRPPGSLSSKRKVGRPAKSQKPLPKPPLANDGGDVALSVSALVLPPLLLPPLELGAGQLAAPLLLLPESSSSSSNQDHAAPRKNALPAKKRKAATLSQATAAILVNSTSSSISKSSAPLTGPQQLAVPTFSEDPNKTVAYRIVDHATFSSSSSSISSIHNGGVKKTGNATSFPSLLGETNYEKTKQGKEKEAEKGQEEEKEKGGGITVKQVRPARYCSLPFSSFPPCRLAAPPATGWEIPGLSKKTTRNCLKQILDNERTITRDHVLMNGDRVAEFCLKYVLLNAQRRGVRKNADKKAGSGATTTFSNTAQ